MLYQTTTYFRRDFTLVSKEFYTDCVTVKLGFHDESEKNPANSGSRDSKKKLKKITKQLKEAYDNRTFEGCVQVFLAEK